MQHAAHSDFEEVKNIFYQYKDIFPHIRQDNIWKYDKTLSGKLIDEVNFCNLKQNMLVFVRSYL